MTPERGKRNSSEIDLRIYIFFDFWEVVRDKDGLVEDCFLMQFLERKWTFAKMWFVPLNQSTIFSSVDLRIFKCKT